MGEAANRSRDMSTSTVHVRGGTPNAEAAAELAAAGDLDNPVGSPAPCLMLDDGTGIPLLAAVTTVGRGGGVTVRFCHPGVSRLHAELIRRGPFLYVSDAGLSRNGTFVNGEPVVQALLTDGDVVSFGGVRARIAGTTLPGPGNAPATACAAGELALSGREIDVLIALCRPGYAGTAFVAPLTALGIAKELVVTEAAVKQHLLRLYVKFGIAPGLDRRIRLANAVVETGILHRRLCLAAYGPGALDLADSGSRPARASA